MKDLKEYAIPVGKLREGMHTFRFEVDWQFFSQFEDSPLDQGRFEVHVDFDKHADHWLVQFKVTGLVDTACDRCLAQISLPVEGAFAVVVKYEDDRAPEIDDESDVIYVTADMNDWEVAQLLYEFILLSIPVQKVYDCENEQPQPCDQDALSKLEEGEQQESADPNSIWDALKDIELKK